MSEKSVLAGLATAGAVIAISSSSLPSLAEIRANDPGDDVLSDTERQATVMGAALVLGLTAITRDATVFVLGGGAVVAMAWAARYNNQIDPGTGRVSDPERVAPSAPAIGRVEPSVVVSRPASAFFAG